MDRDNLKLETTEEHQKAIPPGQIHREVDSLDDFEHLGHDSSPLKEQARDELNDFLDSLNAEPVARDVQALINKGVEEAATAVHAITDDPLSPFDPLNKTESAEGKKFDNMDSNFYQMGDSFSEPQKKTSEDKLDEFMKEMQPFASPKHQEPPENLHKDLDGFKAATQNFMDNERELIEPKSTSAEFLDRYSDSEPEGSDNNDDFHKSTKIEEQPKKEILQDTFKELQEFEVSPPKTEPAAYEDISSFDPLAPSKAEPLEVTFSKEKASDIHKPFEPIKEKEKLPEKLIDLPKKKEANKSSIEDVKPKIGAIQAEVLFRKMGLDAWFNPERLNPRVESLIYWRDPKKTGPVFGGVLVVLLALTYFSLISVVAYLSLLVLTGTISFRIYKNIVQAVQKTGDGHPFKEFLEFNVTLSQDKVKEITEIAVAHFNAAVIELRRLFLVEDLVDSIKFGVLLWTLTYLGAWFNGMTLVIMAWVALFTLPKVYETNKTQIDANLDIARTKIEEITAKAKAIFSKKAEEKKEQ